MPKYKKDEASKPKNLYLEATRAGDIEAVRALLDAGVVVDVHSRSKSTALMRAAWEGHEQIVRLLLERGASVNACNEKMETALTRAAAQGHLSIVELLLSAGAEVDDHRNRIYTEVTAALGEALLNGHKNVAFLLYNRGADPNLAMGKIVAQGRIDLLDVLLSMKADVNEGTYGGYTPLMRSATMGNLEMTQALLARGANPNTTSQSGETALGQALRLGEKPAVVSALLQNGARCWFLNEAVLLEDAEAVRHLLADGADVNDYRPYSAWPSSSRMRPIRLAREKGNQEIVQLLLDSGAK